MEVSTAIKNGAESKEQKKLQLKPAGYSLEEYLSRLEKRSGQGGIRSSAVRDLLEQMYSAEKDMPQDLKGISKSQNSTFRKYLREKMESEDVYFSWEATKSGGSEKNPEYDVVFVRYSSKKKYEAAIKYIPKNKILVKPEKPEQKK